jgi:uncharacterized surface protein with fasciclin (FAS1) repeats
MDRQILFLFSALKGYLDWMTVDLVPVFEFEWFKFYAETFLEYPMKSNLQLKNNELDDELANYLIWHFTAGFINHAIRHYNYGV